MKGGEETGRIGRRGGDLSLGRTIANSRKWFVALIGANLLSILLLAFHVGMWRQQAAAADKHIDTLVDSIAGLKRQVDEQARELARLAGVIEGGKRAITAGPQTTAVPVVVAFSKER